MTGDHTSSSHRSMLPRNDSEALLDYYQSPLADKGLLDHKVNQVDKTQPLVSAPSSSSSSDYSSSDSEYSTHSPSSSPPRARREAPQPGAEDRRRLAVVPTSGIDTALVMPPDGPYKHHRAQSQAVEEDIAKRPGLAQQRRSTGQSVMTPDIGDNKSIDIPVAPPVIVGTFSSQAPDFLSYTPGIHSTAGPLPPPPSLDPQKRDQIEAVRKALQLPSSVEAVLARRTPSPLHSDHKREGAFSPTISEQLVTQTQSLSSHPPVTITPLTSPTLTTPVTTATPVISSPPLPHNVVLHDPPPTYKKRVSAELSISDHDYDDFTPAPSPPPKSLRNSLQRGLRRMSLSRSPSTSSRTPSPPETPHHSRYPHSPRPRPPVTKIKGLYPSAMYCHELHPLNGAPRLTSLDRCNIYAQKINELYVYDCGLGDWLLEARIRTRTTSINEGGGTSIPSTKVFTPQPRNVSQGSEAASEMTFPVRPDASVATDLSSPGSTFSIPTNVIPLNTAILPYPSLPPRTTSTPKTGFFSSLGRKGSTSKKGVPVVTLPTSQSAPRTVLTKRPTVAPSVPGGPRPPGGWKRMSRSQTVSIPRHGSESDVDYSKAEMLPVRQHTPSLSPPQSAARDPEFEKQLDKLAVLLPQADRSVLAGYLRRAGSDLVAIGLYIEDQKNGKIRRD